MTTIGPFSSYHKARGVLIEELIYLVSPITEIKIYKKRYAQEWYIDYNNPNKDFQKIVAKESEEGE